MAKSHSTNGVYTNPEVRFERTDIEAGAVVRFAVILALILTVTGILALLLARWVKENESERKRTTLKPAAGDRDLSVIYPPEPRLEALDDVRGQNSKNFQIYPARAAEYYRAQEKLLREGDPRQGIAPISEAMNDVAGVRIAATLAGIMVGSRSDTDLTSFVGRIGTIAAMPSATRNGGLPGLFPARNEPPPAAFGVALPSKAAAGRVVTGSQ